MRQLVQLAIAVVVLLQSGCARLEVKQGALECHDDLVFAKGANVPFSGLLVTDRGDGVSVPWATYRRGRLHGPAWDWYPHGQIEKETNWREGVEQGKCVEFRPLGGKFREYEYVAGKLDGEFREYNRSGQLARRCVYRSGERVEGPIDLDPDYIFERALDSQSTAPAYVVVTIVVAKTGERFETCLDIVSFLNNLAEESGLVRKDEPAYYSALEKLAMPHKADRTFLFGNEMLVRAMRPTYAPQELAAVREILREMPRARLLTLAGPDGWNPFIHQLETAGVLTDTDIDIDGVVAHVLFERGVLTGRGCLSSALWVEE